MTDWAKKYMPTCMEEMILPPAIKRALVAIRDREVGPSLLFHGPHGCGKTSAAILLQKLDKVRLHDSRADTEARDLWFTIDESRLELDKKLRRLIVIDNADLMKPSGQIETRIFMDHIDRRDMFVLTANDYRKLGNAILSSVVAVDFSQMRGDPELKDEMQIRALQVLESEGIEVDTSIVRGIVNRWFPDMRQVLKAMQFKLGLLT